MLMILLADIQCTVSFMLSKRKNASQEGETSHPRKKYKVSFNQESSQEFSGTIKASPVSLHHARCVMISKSQYFAFHKVGWYATSCPQTEHLTILHASSRWVGMPLLLTGTPHCLQGSRYS